MNYIKNILTIILFTFSLNADASELADSIARYQGLLNDGSITVDDFHYLVGGAVDTEMIKSGNIIQPMVIEETREQKEARYQVALDSGQISQNTFDFLIGSLDDLDSIKALVKR